MVFVSRLVSRLCREKETTPIGRKRTTDEGKGGRSRKINEKIKEREKGEYQIIMEDIYHGGGSTHQKPPNI